MRDESVGWYRVPGRPRQHRYWTGEHWIEPEPLRDAWDPQAPALADKPGDNAIVPLELSCRAPR